MRRPSLQLVIAGICVVIGIGLIIWRVLPRSAAPAAIGALAVSTPTETRITLTQQSANTPTSLPQPTVITMTPSLSPVAPTIALPTAVPLSPTIPPPPPTNTVEPTLPPTNTAPPAELPTRTPRPTRTPKLQYKVTYIVEVTGQAKDALITYALKSGVTSQLHTTAPWSYTIPNADPDTFLYVSAQSEDRESTASCKILVNDEIFDTDAAFEEFGIAKCSGTIANGRGG